MNQRFKVGDKIEYRKVIGPSDIAAFHGDTVHPVYATFSLARDAEWTTRQFVLAMRGDDEEGIGTSLSVEHHAPAFMGEEINFLASIERIDGNELICSYEARVADRLIATGKTGQKILPRNKIARLFTRPQKH
jgi:fluoroacetyl-CoA thioesterase